MEIERTAAGDVLITGITPLLADTMLRIPDWLECDDPRVRDRLLPRAYEADDEEAQWRRLGVPDLEHLFASRVELIRGDLERMTADQDGAFALELRAGHLSAWLSGLNGARLALYALHEFSDEDLEREPSLLAVAEAERERELALLRIHVMAFLQESLLEDDA